MAPPHSARGKVTDPVKAGAVLTMRKEGRSYSAIEKAIGVKKRTAINIFHQAESRAGEKATLPDLLSRKNVDPASKSGRPSKFSERDKRYLIRLVERPENRRATLSEIANLSGLHISRETVRKVLNNSGLHWRKPRRKPMLTKEQKKKRLEWCKAHSSEDTDWSTWIFTDETSVVPGQTRGREGVWRRIGEEYDGNKGTVNRKKTGRQSSIMFWGVICRNVRGTCHVWTKETGKEKKEALKELEIENEIAEEMARKALHPDAPTVSRKGRKPQFLTEQKKRKKNLKGIDWYRYRKHILRPKLYPFYHKIKTLKGAAILMEDGAGPHSNHLLNEEREKEGVVQEDWPSSSPDLNPIESIWNIMKDNLSARIPKVTKVKDIMSILVEEWEAIPQEKFDSLIDTMPKRIAACIKDKGGNNYNY